MSLINRALQLTALAAVTTASNAGSPPPLFGDWWYLMPDGWRDASYTNTQARCETANEFTYDQVASFVPVNQPSASHGGPGYEPGSWMADYALCVAERMHSIGAPIALMIRERNCPFPYGNPGNIDPLALETALDQLPKLDYLLMDLEPWGENGEEMVRRNIEEIYRLVREHPNPLISNAAIGNYNDWPGMTDEASIWPSKRDRTADTSHQSDATDRDIFYKTFLNVAMPVAYPYESYSRHSDAAIQGANVTPNDRAAIFWAPLERASVAARNLPDGNLLIPWISNYVEYAGSPTFYHAPAPSESDIRALVQHLRLRGAHSYMIWTSDKANTSHPTIDYQTFREMSLDAWTELDDFFNSSENHEFLNLETDKKSGLQWSGVRAGSEIRILVSNMHHSRAMAAPLPPTDGLPSHTPLVGPGEHAVFTYSLDPAVRDFEGDGDIDTSDFMAFITALRNNSRVADNAVGGKGIDARDVDASGLIDLRDVIAVANAIREGRFNTAPKSFARGRGTPQGSGKRTNGYASVNTD